MKKTKKKLLLCGLLTLFAAANLFVAASNEKQKKILCTDDAEAFDFSLLLSIIENSSTNNNVQVFRYKIREGLSCAPVLIFSGNYQKGSSAANALDANLGFSGNSTFVTGSVNGSANASYQASRQTTSNYDYAYAVNIVLAGDDWEVITCEPCSENDPKMIGRNCKGYSECADAVNLHASAYRAALGLQ